MPAPVLPVVRIQRHCLHDGPGIRTTVFLQGCALACPWCANPESIPPQAPRLFDERKCVARAHPGSPLCTGCSLPVDGRPPAACPFGAVRPGSTDLDIHEIHRRLIRDAALYRDSGGGITFSGGEPFLHAQALTSLLPRLKQEGLAVAFETSGYFPPRNAPLLLPFIDHILLDLKILAPPVLNPAFSLPADAFSRNLKAICASSAALTYRLLLIRELLETPGQPDRLISRLERLPPADLELLPLHSLAESKYRQLGRPCPPFSPPSPAACLRLKEHVQSRLKIQVRLLTW